MDKLNEEQNKAMEKAKEWLKGDDIIINGYAREPIHPISKETIDELNKK